MLWDVASGELVGLLGVHVGWGNSLAFSPDGAILATGAEDGIILWDLAKMQPLGETLREHRTPVSRLIFNPDGDLLASASQDGAVILWDVSSRLPLGEPLVAEDPSGIRESILAFSPDGKSLVSFHEDGILSTWEVDVQSWHRRICDRVSRNFTQAEWDLYFPDEPYRKTCGQWPEGS